MEIEDREVSTINNVNNNDIESLRGCFDEAIVVLQGGIVKGPYGGAKISKLPRMRQFAAIASYYDALDQGKSPVIILSGGASINVEDGVCSETFLMKKHMVETYGIEPWRIIEEDRSIDTATNAECSAEILEILGFLENGRVKLITNAFHLDRSKMLFDRYYKGDITPVAAESVLIARGEKSRLPGDAFDYGYGEYAKLFLDTEENKRLERKDRLLKAIYSSVIGTKLVSSWAIMTREKIGDYSPKSR